MCGEASPTGISGGCSFGSVESHGTSLACFSEGELQAHGNLHLEPFPRPNEQQLQVTKDICLQNDGKEGE